jgi:hypothetical protein
VFFSQVVAGIMRHQRKKSWQVNFVGSKTIYGVNVFSLHQKYTIEKTPAKTPMATGV